ncbi:MAG: hypothetical protein WCJ35_00425 [Planctomycetota bacterium]
MWWTPVGKRILQGAEGRLFRDALGIIVDMVRDDAEGLWQFGAPPFDKLQPNQKLAVLAEVGSALLCEDQPMPRLTAVEEATVGAVYEAIRLLVEMEIDQPPEWRESPSWRELVLAACQERGIEELLDAQSEDLDEWEVLIGSLAGEVLWDEDWKDSESLMDADPRAGRAVKELLGIDEDYYIAVPPDPTEEEMKGVWATLRGLTKGGE